MFASFRRGKHIKQSKKESALETLDNFNISAEAYKLNVDNAHHDDILNRFIDATGRDSLHEMEHKEDAIDLDNKISSETSSDPTMFIEHKDDGVDRAMELQSPVVNDALDHYQSNPAQCQVYVS